MKLQNKLLKNVDPDVYRKFRAYCVGEGLTVGRALSALMVGTLQGIIALSTDSHRVSATSIKSAWTWSEIGKGDRDE